jgi:hypothetical protein
MNSPMKHYRKIQVLLTLGCVEFFGPMVKDTGASHLLNEEWVGHAKIHLGWLLGFMFFSGLANLYLIWIRGGDRLACLKVTALWQGCHLAGFWGAVITAPMYGGQLVDERYHMHILGIEENAFVFGILTIILIAAVYFLRLAQSESSSQRADDEQL